MKVYTYPIKYTEMCPYSVTAVGTTCLLADVSNRLTISKLNSKESIIGKPIASTFGDRRFFTAIISEINKNVIMVDRTTISPQTSYYTLNYITSPTSEHKFEFNESVTTEGSPWLDGVSLWFEFSTPLMMYATDSVFITGTFNYAIKTMLNGENRIPKQGYIRGLYLNEFSIKDLPYIDNEFRGSYIISQDYPEIYTYINYRFYIAVPAWTTSTIHVEIKISEFDLYEQLCPNKIVNLKMGTHLCLPTMYPRYEVTLGDLMYVSI